MYDGVSNGTRRPSRTRSTALKDAGKPIYQIAAPAQAWNAFGATTNALLDALATPDRRRQFAGVVLAGGSHVDSMLGVNPLFDGILQLVDRRSPAGNTAAVYTLSTGWINDMYHGPSRPSPGGAQYGFYAGANQAIIMGPTAALALPTPVANQLSLGDQILTGLIDAVGGLFGFSILPTPVNTGNNGVTGVVVPTLSNGVTGVRVGSSTLTIPSGDGIQRPGRLVLPDPGRRLGAGQRRDLAAARVPRLQGLVRRWPRSRSPRRPTASWWCRTSSGSTTPSPVRPRPDVPRHASAS